MTERSPVADVRAVSTGRSHTWGVRILWGAAAVGAVHAGFSLYWACGGRWLLATVGAWAVRLADRSPLVAGVVLGLVAGAKVVGAAIPVLVETGRLGGRRVWRPLVWGGAVVLMAYGTLNVVVGWAVLGGIIKPSEGYDHAAELGHAALWDPLFLIWGVLLAVGLRLTRGPLSPQLAPRQSRQQVGGVPAGGEP